MTTNTSAQNTRCHDSNEHTKGLALCHRLTLQPVHTGGSWQGHPQYTSASTEEGRGWPDTRSTRRPQNDSRQRQVKPNVLSGDKCGPTHVNQHNQPKIVNPAIGLEPDSCCLASPACGQRRSAGRLRPSPNAA